MILKFGNYTIQTIDKLNIGLYEKRIASIGKNKGEENSVLLGYYSDVKSALLALTRKSINNDDYIQTVEDLIERIDALENLIQNFERGN